MILIPNKGCSSLITKRAWKVRTELRGRPNAGFFVALDAYPCGSVFIVSWGPLLYSYVGYYTGQYKRIAFGYSLGSVSYTGRNKSDWVCLSG